MDEILIEEKKYISSKRAAQITGYAKDYVGQLCREGRVPARLVGRGWYVLESAIQDHRFGGLEPEPKKTSKESKEKTSESRQPLTWEVSRYEAVSENVLPPIQKAPEDVSSVQDSWREWFDHFVADPVVSGEGEPSEETEKEEAEKPEEPEQEEKREEREENDRVEIPIRVYQPPPEELLPRRAAAPLNVRTIEEPPVKRIRAGNRTLVHAVRTVSILSAFVVAFFALVGSGYFDEYLILDERAGMTAGVILYDK